MPQRWFGHEQGRRASHCRHLGRGARRVQATAGTTEHGSAGCMPDGIVIVEKHGVCGDSGQANLKSHAVSGLSLDESGAGSRCLRTRVGILRKRICCSSSSVTRRSLRPAI